MFVSLWAPNKRLQSKAFLSFEIQVYLDFVSRWVYWAIRKLGSSMIPTVGWISEDPSSHQVPRAPTSKLSPVLPSSMRPNTWKKCFGEPELNLKPENLFESQFCHLLSLWHWIKPPPVFLAIKWEIIWSVLKTMMHNINVRCCYFGWSRDLLFFSCAVTMNFTWSPKLQNQDFSDPRTELAYNHVKTYKLSVYVPVSLYFS